MTATESIQADPKAQVLITGDLLIDRTFYVDVPKLSPEAPVPVAMLTGRPVDTPGGAGLAAAFASVAQIPTIFATYTSTDLATWMSSIYDIPIIYPSIHSDNTNAVKTRYIDNERHYHLLRVDSDRTVTTPFQNKEDEEAWFNWIKTSIRNEHVRVLALLDYRKGLLNEARSQRLITMAHNANIPVYVDSRSNSLQKFKGADIIKLNSSELENTLINLNCDSIDKLATRLDIRCVIETMGAKGARAFSLDLKFGICQQVKNGYTTSYTPDIGRHEGSPDVTGCGDVFDVTFCHQWGIKKVGFDKAIKIAVETATKFAYKPIGERLQCQN
jgi:bifunctional ADP-heptose synthase (sugar kinase/adenylyltransferase)